MSYLNTPRLTFSGQFQADPSTVNNDPTHYNNAAFKTSYQEYGPSGTNGWWNPDGTGNWRLIGCKITSVTYKDGTSTDNPESDPIIGMAVIDTDNRTAGKIVDLDPQQQMVSQIWGLIVRIVNNEGNELMKGNYEMAPFSNIWFNRSVGMKGSTAAGATYQSVVSNIQWNEEFVNSRYFNELKEVSPDKLSMQFTVDRYNSNHIDPQFTLGRIAGSIGPTGASEPDHFVMGRQLFPAASQNCNYATAYVDEPLQQVVLDMGNALQFNSNGQVYETRDLRLGMNIVSNGGTTFTEIGKIDYSDPGWYMDRSGVCTFPLDKENMGLIQQNPLVIMSVVAPMGEKSTGVKTTYTPVLAESEQYVCADQFVFRLDPSDTCSIDFYATTLGRALSNAIIQVQDDTATLLSNQSGPNDPDIGTPELASLPTTITTDANGKATLTFKAIDPKNPRGYIDGQIYGLSYNLQGQDFSTQCNPSNFISLLIFDGPPAIDPAPGWESIYPIMQQYANLYPLMSKGIFNLANQEVVDKNAQILQLVFSKDIHDPNYMPATRDLSAYKKTMILNYLQTVINADSK